jgi:F0F1-type ATP synthase membrane subunit b/b'
MARNSRNHISKPISPRSIAVAAISFILLVIVLDYLTKNPAIKALQTDKQRYSPGDSVMQKFSSDK